MFASLLLAAALQTPAAGDFPAFVWRGPNAAEDEEAAARLAPFGGAVVIGADEASWVRGQGLEFFVFNAPGRDVLHLDRTSEAFQERWRAWYADRDDARLLRQPCLTDPEAGRELHRRLAASLEARGGEHGHGASLGDEVSLTPDGSPWDDCLSPTCRARWAERRDDDPARYSTDATRLALTDGDASLLGGWLARRRFHQDVVLGRLEELARTTRARSPGTPVGLLGLAGQTAFGHVDVERALDLVDFIECYPVNGAREQMFTLRRPEQRAWATLFPDAERPHRAARHAWEFWMRGGDGVVVWEEKVLREHPEVAARTARALADIRRLRAELPEFRPRPRGVALIHSSDSIAASWLREALLDGPTWPKRLQGYQEQNGARERALEAWIQALEDASAMPGSLPIDRIDADTLDRFQLLVACHLDVASDEQLARLARFVDEGGTLAIAGGSLGRYDERGRERPAGLALTELSARAPDRVLDLSSVAELRSQIRGLTFERAPWRVVGPGARLVPWCVVWDGEVGAVLPNPPRGRGGASRPLEIGIDAPDGFSVEWIHPAAELRDATVVVPPGDAAVFRLALTGR